MTVGHVIRKQRIKNGMYALLGNTCFFTGLTWVRSFTNTAPLLRVLIYYKVNSVPGNTLSVAPQTFSRLSRCILSRHR